MTPCQGKESNLLISKFRRIEPLRHPRLSFHIYCLFTLYSTFNCSLVKGEKADSQDSESHKNLGNPKNPIKIPKIWKIPWESHENPMGILGIPREYLESHEKSQNSRKYNLYSGLIKASIEAVYETNYTDKLVAVKQGLPVIKSIIQILLKFVILIIEENKL